MSLDALQCTIYNKDLVLDKNKLYIAKISQQNLMIIRYIYQRTNLYMIYFLFEIFLCFFCISK